MENLKIQNLRLRVEIEEYKDKILICNELLNESISKYEDLLSKYEKITKNSFGKKRKKSIRKTTRTHPGLWKKIVAEVKRGSKGGRKGQWSARKAQLAVKIYKKRGGGYKGSRSRNNSLKKWTRQKWRTKSGRPSLKTGERYLPEKAIKRLTKREYERTSAAKRRSLKKGKQYSKQPKNIARKVKKYRN